MSCAPIDSRTQSGGRLPATARSHGLRYGERGHAASSGRDLKAFAYYRTRAEGFLSECAVGLEDQAHGFVEVGSGFLERRPLGVGARKLFQEGQCSPRAPSQIRRFVGGVSGAFLTKWCGEAYKCLWTGFLHVEME